MSSERGKEASFSSQQRKSRDQITRCCSRKLALCAETGAATTRTRTAEDTQTAAYLRARLSAASAAITTLRGRFMLPRLWSPSAWNKAICQDGFCSGCKRHIYSIYTETTALVMRCNARSAERHLFYYRLTSGWPPLQMGLIISHASALSTFFSTTEIEIKSKATCTKKWIHHWMKWKFI